MAKVTNITIQVVQDTKRQVKADWRFGDSHIDHYEIRWDWYTKQNGWVYGNISSVKPAQSLWNVPTGGNAYKLVRICVRPISTKRTEQYQTTNSSGKVVTKERQVDWFSAEWVTSSNFEPWNAFIDDMQDEFAASDAYWQGVEYGGLGACYAWQASMRVKGYYLFTLTSTSSIKDPSTGLPYGMKAYTGTNAQETKQFPRLLWCTMVKGDVEASKYWPEAVKLYRSASEQYKLAADSYKRGLSDSRVTQTMIDTATKYVTTYKDKADALEVQIAEAEKKRLKTYFETKAKESANLAATKVTDAANKRKSKLYGDSAAAERLAADYFKKAASYYNQAMGYVEGADAKDQYKTKWVTPNEKKADNATSRASSDEKKQKDAEALAAEKSAAPSAPNNLSIARSGGSAVLTGNDTAKWSKLIEVQSYDYAKSAWVAKGTVGVTEGKTGSFRYSESGHVAGDKVRIRVRALLANEKTASAWVTSDVLEWQPAAGTDLKLTVTSPTTVKVTWKNAGRTGDEIEVQYSTYFVNGQTAWAAGALDAITTKNVDGSPTTYTITGLEPNKKVYVRVRRVNDAGGTWVYVDTKAKTVTASATPPKAVSTLAPLTNLIADYVSATDAYALRVRFSGIVEDGTDLAVEYSEVADAWSLGLTDKISSIDYEPASDVRSHTASTTVTAGRTYYVRVSKGVDNSYIVASLSSSSARQSDGIAKVIVPSRVTPTLDAPSDLRLTAPYDQSIRVDFAATAGSGDSFEVQYTSNAFAYDDNAFGDIQSTTLEADDVSQGATRQVITISGLDDGTTYYIRVRRVRGELISPWTDVASQATTDAEGTTEVLYAPIVTFSSEAREVGTDVTISWLHNSDSESVQTAYNVEVTSNGEVIANVQQESSDNFAIISLADVEDGSVINWRVRTAGAVTTAWSPWSAMQSFMAFAAPTAGVAVTTSGGINVGTNLPLSSMPMVIVASMSETLGNQPVELRLSVTAVNAYEGVSADGSPSYVSQSEELWWTEISDGLTEGSLSVTVEASEIALMSGQEYEARAIVMTEQGMMATSVPYRFAVEWDGEVPQPTCFAEFDPDAYVARVYPACYVPVESPSPIGEVEQRTDTYASAQLPLTIDMPVDTMTIDTVTAFDGEDELAAAWAYDPETFTLVVTSVAGEADEYDIVVTSTAMAVPDEPQEPEIPTSGVINVDSSTNGEVAVSDAVSGPLAGLTVYGPVDSNITVYVLDEDDEGAEGWPLEVDLQGNELEVDGDDRDYVTIDQQGNVTLTKVVGLPNPQDTSLGSVQLSEVPSPVFTCHLNTTADFDLRYYGVAPGTYAISQSEWDDVEETGAIEFSPTMSEMPDYSAEATELKSATDGSGQLVEGVTLDVWRVNYDGTTTLVGEGLPNDGLASVTDPHPSFGTCRYRIVAHDANTDLQAAAEYVIETPVDRIVVSWGGGQDREDETLFGTQSVELPYGLQLQETHAMESEAVAYAGRSLPVAYFGDLYTSTASYSASILRQIEDGEIDGLRRLSRHAGPAYVRDPEGIGMWAIVTVDMSHRAPYPTSVSINAQRVDVPAGEVG